MRKVTTKVIGRVMWLARGTATMLGLALLLRTFHHLREHGIRRASLVVDSDIPTGAARLYERAGMHAERSYAVYRKGLRGDAGRRA